MQAFLSDRLSLQTIFYDRWSVQTILQTFFYFVKLSYNSLNISLFDKIVNEHVVSV